MGERIEVGCGLIGSFIFLCIHRIQQTVRLGNASTVIDPTADKQWESLKAQKQPATSSTSRPICDEPIPHQRSYYQGGSAADWGKNLDSLPALTRREIDLHIDTVNMKFRP